MHECVGWHSRAWGEREREKGRRETSEGETQETGSLTCSSGLFLPTYRLLACQQTAKCAENLWRKYILNLNISQSNRPRFFGSRFDSAHTHFTNCAQAVLHDSSSNRSINKASVEMCVSAAFLPFSIRVSDKYHFLGLD